MIRKLLLSLFLLLSVFLINPDSVFAEGEFSSSYDIQYLVGSDGVTQVTEKVTLKNLTDRYYASSFSLNIGSSQISEVIAMDSKGTLETEINSQGSKTQINVKFNSQIVGKDKEYTWTLKFKSRDFAQAQGEVWQVTIPKIASTTNLDNYNLTLSVPISFGDPTTILPEPTSTSESGGRLHLRYTKDQLVDSGIIANFGTDQLFSYKLKYSLKNEGVLPGVAKLPLPQDTSYQKVLIDNISPRPESVIKDTDGNYIATFHIDRSSTQEVVIEGLAKLFINRQDKITPLTDTETETYTSSQKYWEKDAAQIKERLDEIFKDGAPKTNQEKARLIHKFVSNALTYNEQRIKDNDFERFGALTILGNPDQALCSEYTDLFITLARAAGIPARQLLGYAYTSNTEIRPLSFDSTLLHTWPEYYDPALGWVMIDPTWESTTGGVNYFSKFDLNHFVLATRGSSSVYPSTADKVEVSFSDSEFIPRSDIKLSMDSSSEIFAGFPSKARVRVENIGNTFYPEADISFSAAKLDVKGEQSFRVASIPPFGTNEYLFDLSTQSLWESYDDIIKFQVSDKEVSKKVSVKPFFAYKFFAPAVIGVFAAMFLFYILLLGAHWRHKGLRAHLGEKH